MVMKSIFAEYSEKDDFYIASYGMEDISQNAHWGRGSRCSYIIHYVLSGEGYFNGFKVKEGQGFFIRSGQLHEYSSSKKNPWKYFWVILDGNEAVSVCEKYIHINKNGIFEYDFKNELNSFCKSFFASYNTISSAKSKGVFWMLMSCHEKDRKLSPNKYINEAKKYMEQNMHRPISICEVSDMLHISDRYMYNLFIKYEGVSPKKYLNDLRLKRAADMLKKNILSVTEIAVSLGFADVLTFSRFFKKNMGVSPSEYKAMKN